MDYSKTVDIFDTGVHKQTLLLIPSEMGTRYNYIYSCEELSKYYRVVAMDLPGTGARSDERVNMSGMLQAIYDCIQTNCPNKKAALMGLSMGGYLALRFSAKYPEMVQALILVGCNVEQYGASQIPHAGADLVYSFLNKKERSNIMRKTYPTVDTDRMIRAYMTTTMNYDKAFDFAMMMMEEESEFYLKCIQDFQGKIFLITGENDWRGAEEKFLNAAQKKTETHPEKSGKLLVVPKVAHEVLLHQDSFDQVHKEIRDFLAEVFHDKMVIL
jgi:pimeloyl-ACP methyl ester carboxylesterase